jgi:hypothetical protein
MSDFIDLFHGHVRVVIHLLAAVHAGCDPSSIRNLLIHLTLVLSTAITVEYRFGFGGPVAKALCNASGLMLQCAQRSDISDFGMICSLYFTHNV